MKKTKSKQAISLLLSLLMALSVFQMASVTAFAETEGDFEYYRAWNADEVYVTKYTGASTEVTVPAELGGYPVVEVHSNAFQGNETITKVVLPESVREIGRYAFYGCWALAEIDLPKDLSVIGDSAFLGTAYYDSESNWENNILYLDSYILDTRGDLAGAQTVKNGTTLIADGAFSNTAITGISLPESLVTIGEDAFENCTDLISVTFSRGLRTISPYAFSGCTALQQAVLPESLRSVGYYAFDGCTALQTVTVPAGATSLEDNIFYNCPALREMKGYTASKAEKYARQYGITFISIGMAEEKYSYAYTVLDDGASIAITDYYGAQTELTIPAELDGYTVTEIAENTFRDRPELTKITLPDTLQRIGEDAFFNTGYYNNAANWQENMLYIDQALISVPTGAAGEIAIREGTVLLADNAMYNCKKITAVTLPSTIRYIGDYAMTNCKAVAALNLPEGLLRLGKSALAGCKSIKTLNIPASLTDMDCEFEDYSNIPAAPFSECAGLTEISVASNNPKFSAVDGVLYNKNQTKLLQYPRAKKAASFSVPRSVTEMVYASFAMTSALQSVQLPDTITEIADCTFYEAASLQSIAFPKQLTSIGSEALCGVGLRELTVPDSVTGKLYLDNCDSLQSLTVGNGITSVEVDSSALVSVSVGENVHSISCGAPILQSITVSEKNTEYTSVNGVLYNKDKTVLEHYPAGKKDAELTIPEGVQTIYGVSSQYIKRIHIPASLETFNGVACPMLESISVADANPNYSAQDGVLFNKDKTELLLYPTKKSQTAYTVPSSVTTLANGAFNDAVYLESLVLPESITQIGTALSRCPALRAVHIPAGLTSLDSDAFLESTALESFTVAAENPNYVAVDGILFNKAKTELIRYPAAKTSTSYAVPQSVTQLVYGAFLGASALQSVTLPATLKSIPASGFQGCTSLKSIAIPAGVESLEYSAFLNCKALADVSLPSSLQGIEPRAFCGCASLKTVKLPDNLTRLGWASFANSGLEEVFVPASVSCLTREGGAWGGTAFIDCTALKQITVSPDNPTYEAESTMLMKKETGELLQYALASPETELTIPDTVTDIGSSAFQNADLLKTVTIPGTVKTVKLGAFYDCDALKNVVLSEGVESIEGCAFVGCDSLQSIWIPRSVTGISRTAFDFYMSPSEKLTIYGYYGSEADAFARAYGYAFVDVSPRLQVPTDEKNGVIDVVLPQTTIQMVLDAVALQAEQEIIAVTVTEADGTVVTDYTALAQKGFVFTLTFADNSVSVYEIPAVTVGDVNGDDKINAVDARWVLQIASGVRTIDADEISAADVNQDNKVNAVDARWILQVASGARTL